MRYTRYNDELGRYVVPCLYKENGEQIRFYFKTEAEETLKQNGRTLLTPQIEIVFGEVIDRLAQLENSEELEMVRGWQGTMSAREAITLLQTEHVGDSERLEFAKFLGARALARLRPRRPKMRAYEGFAPEVASHLCCPACGNSVTNYWVPGTKPKHCQFCGQALDWGEEGET